MQVFHPNVTPKSVYAMRSNGTIWAWGHTGNLVPGGRSGDLTPRLLIDSVDVENNCLSFLPRVIRSDGSLWGINWDVSGNRGDGRTWSNIGHVPYIVPETNYWIMDAAATVFLSGFDTPGYVVRQDGSLYGRWSK